MRGEFKKSRGKALAVFLCVLAAVACERGKESPRYSGVLEAVEVEVRAEVGGRVVSVMADEGERVEEGQIICELDREKLLFQLRAAQGELTAQKAKLEAMEKGARKQELAQVRAARDAARIQRMKAERDYQKIERLFARGAVSEFERDNARVRRDLAREQEKRAEEAYQLALEGVRDEELRGQAAVVDAVSAKVDFAKRQLEDATIRSPISGRVVERYVERGELVMPGGLIATVADYRRLELKVYVPETEVGKVQLGQKAEVFVDAFPERAFSAHVARKSKQWEFTPKTVQTKEERTTLVYEVTLAVDNPDELALAGLPADAVFLEEYQSPERSGLPREKTEK